MVGVRVDGGTLVGGRRVKRRREKRSSPPTCVLASALGPLRVTAGGGLVYRNPKPYLKAVNTWHPCMAACP